MKYVALALSLVAFSAHAGGDKQIPTPVEPPGQHAHALAVDSNSSSVANAQTNSYSESYAAPATASNDGVHLQTLALGLGVPSAPSVALECMETTPMTSVLGGARGGRVSINAKCQAFRQCLAVAKLYADMSRQDLAVEQLAKPECGGVEPKPVEAVSCAEHADRALQECARK